MSKIKLTKGELKRQRDSLEQFQHYLPTLQLKKQQLQIKITEAYRQLDEKRQMFNKKAEEISRWAGLLADPSVNLKGWITPDEISIDTVNIAGANIPVFENIHFKEAEYDLYSTPFWTDRGIEELRLMAAFLAEIDILKKRADILKYELRITTQRVNLFEKIKIPECLENIRVIRIYLGDQQANAVGVSKAAKKKIIEYKAGLITV
ncbi:MAG: V-type ATP synthase subunit D [Candidatus Omnitrophica bacterium]|nr:V-type ATP synthase subunit D [Candidatus Omnitrophota bacterium]